MTRDRRRTAWVVLAVLVLFLAVLRLFLVSAYFDLHPNPAKKVVVVFRNDDIQEFSGSAAERRFLKLFAENGIPQTYAVVPFKKNLDKEGEWVLLLQEQQERGLAEIAQHGYAHRNHTGKRRSEFAGRPFEDQAEEIRSGKAHLERIFQREVVTFIPPFNSYDKQTLLACAQNGIKVLSSSPFFPIPHPLPLTVANLNFLLTDPASRVELASGYGGDLSIFIVHYHSYMEEIYREEDYFGKATQLIQTIQRHRNVEVDTLGNVALRYAGYFKERALLDAWYAKAAILLGFLRQSGLVDLLFRLYDCGEATVWPSIVLGILYGAGLLFLGGFVLSFPLAFLWHRIRLSEAWNRRLLFFLASGWSLAMMAVISDARFGIIDTALGVLAAGGLVHLCMRMPRRREENGGSRFRPIQ